jgi:hypothetical protein
MSSVKVVRLTDRERRLILSALRIASEDGSIYNEAECDDEAKRDASIRKIQHEIEVIEAKL